MSGVKPNDSLGNVKQSLRGSDGVQVLRGRGGKERDSHIRIFGLVERDGNHALLLSPGVAPGLACYSDNPRKGVSMESVGDFESIGGAAWIDKSSTQPLTREKVEPISF